MKFLIDVDKKLVCEGFERPFTEEERDTLIRAIGNGKPYEERPQGEWILKEAEYDAGGTLYECTNCHHCDVHEEFVEVPFCWYCGAEMK